ncbi:MAG: alpha/beta hydrolase [Lachnospiraceae bacterium]
MKKIKKIAKTILLVLAAMILLILAAHTVGKYLNSRTPDGGINESMYVEVNGTKQWINIYGEDSKNPLLLYLHGGPGSSTSAIDYAFTRKWADVYTVVTWDQRNCGKSYDAKQNDTKLTKELLMEDGKEMTEFLLDHMGKEKLTILGHSWGSYYGANLVLANPQYYECFIGTGQLVDMVENETAFKKEASRWAKNDEEALALVDQLTPNQLTLEHLNARNLLMEKYGYSMMVDGSDYNLLTTILFHPNYSILDWVKYFQQDSGVYLEFFRSDELKSFSLKNRYKYAVPYYNINGDKDYQANYKLAQKYFDMLEAPYKKMFMMKDTTHGLLESKSEEFSEILHEIADIQKTR